MSKYTTEVRFICESKSGLEISGGSDDVDNIIANSWNKIFTSKAPFFDEKYRSVLCQKILKHYYLREICCETVGIWSLWMNTRLEEIMPYYNQLYESAKIEFNPMHDVDLTRKHERNIEDTSEENGTITQTTKETKNQTTKEAKTQTSEETKTQATEETKTQTTEETKKQTSEEKRVDTGEGSRNLTGSRDTDTTATNTKNTTSSSEETKLDLYSDTPQGAITGLENENYLTNARKITNNISNTGNEQTSATEKNNTDYTENETTNSSTNGTTNSSLNAGTNNSLNGTSNGSLNGTTNGSLNETTNGSLDGTSNGSLDETTSNTGSSNTTEDYLETIVGKQGTESFSTLLNKFRETFLNIDMQVIEEFSDLFFGLW